MANAHLRSEPQHTTPDMDSTAFPSKRRRIVGQCPTCQQAFTSRHELRAHMADPQTHMPASESDAISFGELSSDYDSLDEALDPKPSPDHEHEPTLDAEGFEFSSAAPNLETDGFEFLSSDADTSYFPSDYAAEQGSIHTLPDVDEQPSAEYTPIEIPPRKARPVKGGALGVLYCGTCDKLFGNERVFKRHFMFGVRHGQEEREVRELYHRVWESSWRDEVNEGTKGRVDDVRGTDL